MNINIYYLTKKIIISETQSVSETVDCIDIDRISKKDFLNQFDVFAESKEQALNITTTDIDKGFETFKKYFKFIYAAGGLIKKDDKYLFIFRLKRWDLPKGKFEMGETPEECAIRECEEECGITKLSITKTLSRTLHIYNYKGEYALKHTFWFAMNTDHNDVLVPQTEENIEKVEWFNVSEIKQIVLANSYPAIHDVVNHLL